MKHPNNNKKKQAGKTVSSRQSRDEKGQIYSRNRSNQLAARIARCNVLLDVVKHGLCGPAVFSTAASLWLPAVFGAGEKTIADGVGNYSAVVHLGQSAYYLMLCPPTPLTPAPTGGCRTCCLCHEGLLLPLANCGFHEPPLGQQAESPPENSRRLCEEGSRGPRGSLERYILQPTSSLQNCRLRCNVEFFTIKARWRERTPSERNCQCALFWH